MTMAMTCSCSTILKACSTETGGAVTECGEGHEGHQDTAGEVVPPSGLQFAIDVCDDQSGITHRIGCAKYSPELAFKMAIEAAGLLSNVRPRSVGNALARRMLLAALGGSVGVGSEADDELEELLKKEVGTGRADLRRPALRLVSGARDAADRGLHSPPQ